MIYSSLSIRGFEMRICLGWPDAERMHEQLVLLDIDILFPTPPRACETDHLDDTVCYDNLTRALHEKMHAQSFHLVEYLAHAIYHFIKPQFSADAMVTVRLTKHPRIEGLTGGVCFSYGDRQ